MALICAVAGVIAANKLKNNLDTFSNVLRLDESKSSIQKSKDLTSFCALAITRQYTGSTNWFFILDAQHLLCSSSSHRAAVKDRKTDVTTAVGYVLRPRGYRRLPSLLQIGLCFTLFASLMFEIDQLHPCRV